MLFSSSCHSKQPPPPPPRKTSNHPQILPLPPGQNSGIHQILQNYLDISQYLIAEIFSEVVNPPERGNWSLSLTEEYNNILRHSQRIPPTRSQYKLYFTFTYVTFFRFPIFHFNSTYVSLRQEQTTYFYKRQRTWKQILILIVRFIESISKPVSMAMHRVVSYQFPMNCI